MNKQILWGCVTALALLMAFALLTFVFDARLNQAVMTPLGELPLMDLLGVLVSTAAGGAVAGIRFRWIAVALMGVLWLLTVTVLSAKQIVSLPTMLKYNALAIALTLGLSWLGATLGARLAARRNAHRTAST